MCIKLKCWNNLSCSATKPKIWFLRQGASPPALVKLFLRFRCMHIPVWWCFLVLFALMISMKHVLLLWPSCPISWMWAVWILKTNILCINYCLLKYMFKTMNLNCLAIGICLRILWLSWQHANSSITMHFVTLNSVYGLISGPLFLL